MRKLTAEECAAVLAGANLEALEDYRGGMWPLRCRCLICDAEVSPRLNNIRSGQSSGCKACARKRVVQSKQLSDDARLATLAAVNLKPLVPYPGYAVPWPCRCLICDATVSPQLKTIRQGGGCQACGHARTGQANRTDAATAAATMREHGLEPLAPYPGTNTPWPCKCMLCGAECAPRHSVVQRDNSQGCPTCAWRRLGVARAKPADIAAEAMRARGYEPLEPYPGLARHPWRCRHVCGREVTPSLNQITGGSGGCRSCATNGFKTDRPGWVYLIERPEDGVRQYGITNDPVVRLRTHRRSGFTVVVELFACDEGYQAEEIEATIRAYLRARAIGPACGRHELRGGGWTETFYAAAAPDLRPSNFEPPF